MEYSLSIKVLLYSIHNFESAFNWIKLVIIFIIYCNI